MGDLEAAHYVLLGTIVGALAGVAGSIATAIVANYAEGKRQLLQIALESARHEYTTQIENVSEARVYPFTLMVWNHLEEIKFIRKGNFSVAKLERLHERRLAIMAAIDKRSQ